MKFSRKFILISLMLVAGVSSALAWSANIGRRVWSPRVFGWRNLLKPEPIIAEQPDSPLYIIDARYYSFMSFMSSVGSVLKFNVKNVSDKPVHSFTLSHDSSDPLDTGSIGVQPEMILQPGQAEDAGISARGKDRVTLRIDFVQYADGSTWYPNPARNTVNPEGVQAGAQESINYLRKIMESKGASAVMQELPRIHVDVDDPDFSTRERYGVFGFYCGVTNTMVRVQHAYSEGGLSRVEALLRQ